MKTSSKKRSERQVIPWIFLGFAVSYLLAGLRAPTEAEFHYDEFGKIPVLEGGRAKPIDSISRNSLLLIRGKQKFKYQGKSIDHRKWIVDVLADPKTADAYPVFVVDNPDLLGLLNRQQKDSRTLLTYNDLAPMTTNINDQAVKAREKDDKKRTPFERSAIHLADRKVLYERLKNSLQIENYAMYRVDSFSDEIALYQKTIGPGLEAVKDHQSGKDHDETALFLLNEFFQRYDGMDRFAYFKPILPLTKGEDSDDWRSMGWGLRTLINSTENEPRIQALTGIIQAYQSGDASVFNSRTDDYLKSLQPVFAQTMDGVRHEAVFNRAEPFYRASVLYVLVFLLCAFSWIYRFQLLNKTAFWVVCAAFAAHTLGILSRILIQGYAPVTNLYSSAIFVGCAAVFLGIIMEFIYRNGIGNLTASLIGFGTLIIAHHLSLSGDTMEMMQAVLDSNFWLSTHVTTITIGYSGTFFAGFLGIVYILKGVFTKSLNRDSSKNLTKMVYGIVCFSTLFSFVGTILGGIWADQSWGRFWGWDPKENGALIIVLWNAIILHARWGGYVRDRGIMVMAVFGNVVTSLSWFGVNMLGIGLHAYGFMDSTLFWLIAFIASQLFIMGLGVIPQNRWNSFKKSNPKPA
ncbi:MAG TPA: hypothetical protein EYQ50_07530 [Verrucomicrobiales bacterium]|nr:hypothetical protein [Verrucomicrobiales bacterium]